MALGMVLVVLGIVFAAIVAIATAREYLAIFELREYRLDLQPGQDPLGRGGLWDTMWARLRANDPSLYSEEGRRRLKGVRRMKSVRNFAALGLWIVLVVWVLRT